MLLEFHDASDTLMSPDEPPPLYYRAWIEILSRILVQMMSRQGNGHMIPVPYLWNLTRDMVFALGGNDPDSDLPKALHGQEIMRADLLTNPVPFSWEFTTWVRRSIPKGRQHSDNQYCANYNMALIGVGNHIAREAGYAKIFDNPGICRAHYQLVRGIRTPDIRDTLTVPLSSCCEICTVHCPLYDLNREKGALFFASLRNLLTDGLLKDGRFLLTPKQSLTLILRQRGLSDGTTFHASGFISPKEISEYYEGLRKSVTTLGCIGGIVKKMTVLPYCGVTDNTVPNLQRFVCTIGFAKWSGRNIFMSEENAIRQRTAPVIHRQYLTTSPDEFMLYLINPIVRFYKHHNPLSNIMTSAVRKKSKRLLSYADIRLLTSPWSLTGQYQNQAVILLRYNVIFSVLPPWTVFCFMNRIVLLLHHKVCPRLTARFVSDLEDKVSEYSQLQELLMRSPTLVSSDTWKAISRVLGWPHKYKDLETEVLRLQWKFWLIYMNSYLDRLSDRSDVLFKRGEGRHVDSDVHSLYIAEIQRHVARSCKEVRAVKLALEALQNIKPSVMIHCFSGRRMLLRCWENLLRYKKQHDPSHFADMLKLQHDDAVYMLKLWIYDAMEDIKTLEARLEEYSTRLESQITLLVEHSTKIFAGANENRLITVAAHIMITICSMVGIILGVNLSTIPVSKWYAGLTILSTLSALSIILVVSIGYGKYSRVVFDSYRSKGGVAGDKNLLAGHPNKKKRQMSILYLVDAGP